MNLKTLTRTLLVATIVGSAGTLAHAEGDIYSRLMSMREMDHNKDGMISKDEFLEMVGKLWDMKAGEMKGRNGMLTPDQLQELQKVLSRQIGA
jgi:hypothetical protein